MIDHNNNNLINKANYENYVQTPDPKITMQNQPS